jgi:hypothetical protein
VTYHAGADCLSDHQADLAGTGILSRFGQQVDHDRTAARPAASLGHRGEIGSGTQAVRGGQHRRGRLRRTARRGPYDAGPAGWRVRRGFASADGSRGSWPGGGCSAGRSACSRSGSITIFAPGAQLAGVHFGWVDNVPPESVVTLVERHRKWPPEPTAHESSTVRIDPCRGQTGTVPSRPPGTHPA